MNQEIRYEKEGPNSYLVMDKRVKEETFCEKMIMHAQIPYIIPVSVRHMNSEEYYYYDVTNKIRLDNFLEKKTLKYKELESLLQGLSKTLQYLKECLLSENGLLLAPSFIYVDSEGVNPAFCYYPEKDEILKEDVESLCQLLLDRVDQGDDAAERIAKEFNDQAIEGRYDAKDLFLQEEIEERVFQEVINKDVRKDQEYYFTQPQENEEEPEISMLFPMVICGALILITVSSYLYIYMNTFVMEAFSISEESYSLTFVIFLIITSAIMFIFLKKEKNRIIKNIEKDK